MKGLNGPKLIVVHPSSNKPGGVGNGIGGIGGGAASPPPPSPMSLLCSPHRFWLIVFLSFFTCASLLTLLSTARDPAAAAKVSLTFGSSASTSGSTAAGLPPYVFDALVHYAAAANSTPSMPAADVRAIASVLRRRAPCNLLVFGLGAETPLWRALNHGGRTVFLDENQFYVTHLEEHHPGLEAYDVAYTTTVREFPDLLDAARSSQSAECRPVQNLLFSECRLAINDLPNQLYDVQWEVILVDGPRGYTAASPGRMAAIFTAGVMARSRADEDATTDVLVHDYEREVESACGREFLCDENFVANTSTPSLAHFVVRGGSTVNREAFCGMATTEESTAV